MATVLTIAECRGAAVEKSQLTRASAIASNAEGSQNVIEEVQYNVKNTGTALSPALTGGLVAGKALTYVSFISPTAADFPTASVGDIVRVLKVDSSVSTSAVSDAELWIKTAGGFTKMAADTPVLSITALTDAAATPTAAQILGGVFTMTPGAARNFTLPDAATIYAALAARGGVRVGTAIEFVIVNAAAATHAITVVVGTGNTNKGHADSLIVAATVSGRFKLIVTSSTACDLIRA